MKEKSASKSSSAKSAAPKPVRAPKPAAASRKKAVKETLIVELPLWASLLVFAVATAIFFRAQLFGGMHFWASFMSDFNELHFPKLMFAVQHRMESGGIPFWNPYTFGGMPYMADINTGYFYPFNLALAFTVSTAAQAVAGLERVIMLHFLIAQVAVFVLCRHLKLSSIASIIAALSYGFSSLLVCRIIIQTVLYDLAWFPLIVFFVHKSLTEKSWKDAIYAGLLFALILFSGHPQPTLYIGFFTGLLALWLLITGVRTGELKGRSIAIHLALAAVPFVVGVAVAMIQLLPTQELTAVSARSVMKFEDAADGSLAFGQLLTAVVPKLFGAANGTQSEPASFYLSAPYHYWETAFYFGLVGLTLGLAGTVMMRRTPLGLFLIFVAVLGILYAIGSNGFLFGVFFKLPLFDKFRIPARLMMYPVFALSILSAFAFDKLSREKLTIDFRTAFIAGGSLLVVAFGVTAGVFAGIIGTPPEIASVVQDYGRNALIFLMLILGVLFLLQRGSLSPAVAGALLVTFIIADLNISGAAFKDDARSPADVYQLSPQTAASLRASVPEAFFRVKMREGRTMLLSRNHGLASDIFLIEGFAALYSQRLMPPAPDEATSLDLMTVRYAIAIDSLQQSAYFDERNCRFPHARMVYRTVLTSPDSITTVMRSGKIDFENEAVIEKPLAISLAGFAKNSVGHKVRRTVYRPDMMQFEVETAQAGLLCLSEIWYPAWRVTIDGTQTEIHRTNYSLRGIEVPAGKHVVALRYESQAFAVGAWISSLSLLTVGVALVWLNKKPRAETKNLNGE